jgi:hypothetical protein
VREAQVHQNSKIATPRIAHSARQSERVSYVMRDVIFLVVPVGHMRVAISIDVDDALTNTRAEIFNPARTAQRTAHSAHSAEVLTIFVRVRFSHLRQCDVRTTQRETDQQRFPYPQEHHDPSFAIEWICSS